tara:strand:+ start:2419 stop:2676 length:258 start_codon:yes stop_codon:yes gene_type:complete
MLLLEEECRFKIGDLVVISEPVEFMIYDMIVKPGDVGLVVGVEYDTEILSVWGIDYIVMVRGRTLVFFDQELELFDAKLDGNTKS